MRAIHTAVQNEDGTISANKVALLIARLKEADAERQMLRAELERIYDNMGTPKRERITHRMGY